MSSFKIEMNTDNAAFDGDDYVRGTEVAAILRCVANEIEMGRGSGPVFDINGNRVGNYKMED